MFTRTTCACADCVQCCKTQPGYLGDGDVERIAAHLGETPEAARLHFWASPGAQVQDQTTGRIFRVGTITPRIVRGRCVFLDDADRCAIHAVAPVGCAYFDTHMGAGEGQRRSAWFLRGIIGNAAYAAIRARLPFATSYKPKGYR